MKGTPTLELSPLSQVVEVLKVMTKDERTTSASWFIKHFDCLVILLSESLLLSSFKHHGPGSNVYDSIGLNFTQNARARFHDFSNQL
jgi:hypothetical protein